MIGYFIPQRLFYGGTMSQKNALSSHALRPLPTDGSFHYYALSAIEEKGVPIKHLPVSIRIVLESLLRNCDGIRVKEEDVFKLARWSPEKIDEGDVPFIVSRVILQDFTGVPLLVDLAAMRDAVAKQGKDPGLIEPQVPVDLVVDHSVQVDRAGTEDAFLFNLQVEFDRNQERYIFLKWGQEAFQTFQVVPPGIGIVHQVNLEHLASVVVSREINGKQCLYPDTLVGTDSHTTMINGLGVVGWGVGGIEAEAAMLGQPVALQTPEVIGVHLKGRLGHGVTATDLTLRLTELLRQAKVVGKFVEFFGEGTASLAVADRATIGNMAPEYGATMGFFPVDEATLEYLKLTGRDAKTIKMIKNYLISQNLFGIPRQGEIQYSRELELDLSDVHPCVAGPKRPQDRIDLSVLKEKFSSLLAASAQDGGYDKKGKLPKIGIHAGGAQELNASQECGGTEEIDIGNRVPGWSEAEMVTNRPLTHAIVNPGYTEGAVCDAMLTHGSVVIAAITSCTNTSNPSVMITAGLVAKKAVERGLRISPAIKTSLAPGSRVVTDYLKRAGLQQYLDAIGFQLVAYGCTTCIGNSGPLDERVDKAIKDHDLIAASVLSGNRNFEARIHSSVKANFLMSPPLVVAFALAGKIDINMDMDPIGHDSNGKAVFLREIWPSPEEIQVAIAQAIRPEMFRERYAHILNDNPVWKEIPVTATSRYQWDQNSTYIQQPPYFDSFNLKVDYNPSFQGMRALALFGDSVTTDHISPAGAFHADSPAGQYLLSLGIPPEDFNSYGSRRGNHHVMMRGTFANVRLRNKMAGGKEGGFTKLLPEGKIMTIFEASQTYIERQVPLIVFAGKDYGMGSSRDWAAKGCALLGVKVIIARSFERIHRSNLIGMGVLPLEFLEDKGWEDFKITGDEIFSLIRNEAEWSPQQKLLLEIKRNGKSEQITVLSRLDTQMEVEYYRNGGILPFVLRQLCQT